MFHGHCYLKSEDIFDEDEDICHLAKQIWINKVARYLENTFNVKYLENTVKYLENTLSDMFSFRVKFGKNDHYLQWILKNCLCLKCHWNTIAASNYASDIST